MYIGMTTCWRDDIPLCYCHSSKGYWKQTTLQVESFGSLEENAHQSVLSAQILS